MVQSSVPKSLWLWVAFLVFVMTARPPVPLVALRPIQATHKGHCKLDQHGSYFGWSVFPLRSYPLPSRKEAPDPDHGRRWEELESLAWESRGTHEPSPSVWWPLVLASAQTFRAEQDQM